MIATALLAACGGFLIAVLWMDLMFDVQVLRTREGDVPEDVLASIAAYYRRVTTTARPMGHAVGAMMALLLTLYPPLRILEEIVRVDEPGQFGTGLTISQLISLAMLAAAIALWMYLYGFPPRRLDARQKTAHGLSAA